MVFIYNPEDEESEELARHLEGTGIDPSPQFGADYIRHGGEPKLDLGTRIITGIVDIVGYIDKQMPGLIPVN